MILFCLQILKILSSTPMFFLEVVRNLNPKLRHSLSIVWPVFLFQLHPLITDLYAPLQPACGLCRDCRTQPGSYKFAHVGLYFTLVSFQVAETHQQKEKVVALVKAQHALAIA